MPPGLDTDSSAAVRKQLNRMAANIRYHSGSFKNAQAKTFMGKRNRWVDSSAGSDIHIDPRTLQSLQNPNMSPQDRLLGILRISISLIHELGHAVRNHVCTADRRTSSAPASLRKPATSSSRRSSAE